MHMIVQPWFQPLLPMKLTEPGEVSDIYIRSFTAGNVPSHIAADMVQAATAILGERYPHISPRVDMVMEKNVMGSASGILIVATTTTHCLLAGSALGSPKRRAEEVDQEAAMELVQALDSGGCVDEWLQDQMIVYMALASGTSEMLVGCLTLHTQTAIEIAKQVCGAKITIISMEKQVTDGEGYGREGRILGKHLIRCIGINHVLR